MKFHAIAAASAAFLLSRRHARNAAQVAALVGDNTIAIVDTDGQEGHQDLGPFPASSGRVAGIDVRPADGMLYAVSDAGGVYTVDTSSGKATMKSKLSTMLKPGMTAVVDFNPAADRLRMIGSDGTNLRANVDDGKVIEDGDLHLPIPTRARAQTPG